MFIKKAVEIKTVQHRRLGYLIKQHDSSLVNLSELRFCEVFAVTKEVEVAVTRKTDNRTLAVGPRLKSDTKGPFEVPSMHSAHYDLNFNNNFSRVAVVKKSNALLKLQKVYLTKTK